MSLPLKVRRLGRQPYEATWEAMSQFTNNRGPDTPDELWLLEHDPVFTLGLVTYGLGLANVPGIIMTIVIGALLLVTILYMPGGYIVWLVENRHRWSSRRRRRAQGLPAAHAPLGKGAAE